MYFLFCQQYKYSLFIFQVPFEWGTKLLTSSGTRHSIGYLQFFPGGKGLPGRDAYHSPSSNAQAKNEYELCALSPFASAWR
jgi:hypothetical protein